MVERIKKTFSSCKAFDVDAINSLPLGPPRPWLENSFSEHEVTAAVRKKANGIPQEIVDAPPSIARHFSTTESCYIFFAKGCMNTGNLVALRKVALD
jgi:hypothetical protein